MGVVTEAMTKLALAGQAGKISPRKLKFMVISSAKKNRHYRDWQPDASLEQRHGFMAGAPRFNKVG